MEKAENARKGGYPQRDSTECKGYEWAVPFDFSKYFVTLNHETLLNLLRETVKDERIIQLIKIMFAPKRH